MNLFPAAKFLRTIISPGRDGVSFYFHGEEDIPFALALFRRNYERIHDRKNNLRTRLCTVAAHFVRVTA